MSRPHVIKVGGSLLAWPAWPGVLNQWLARAAGPMPLLLPGGGPFADAVRDLDAVLDLYPQAAHRLAMAAMSLTGEVLCELLPRCTLVADPAQAARAQSQRRWPVVLASAWLGDGAGDLPASWDVTSDSLAVILAQSVQAERLTLLKSRAAQAGTLPADWVRSGLVDAWFSRALARVPGLSLELVNLRAWEAASALIQEEV